jgi:hypothetical protein
MNAQTAIGQQRRTQPQAPAAPGRLAGAAGLIFAAILPPGPARLTRLAAAHGTQIPPSPEP